MLSTAAFKLKMPLYEGWVARCRVDPMGFVLEGDVQCVHEDVQWGGHC